MTAEEKQAAIISEHMREMGRKGGRSTSKEKRAAILKNLAKTRTHKTARKRKSK